MSQADSSSAVAAQVASLFETMLLANFCGAAATTLLFYDYILTFSREIRCIWHRKFTGATVLFLLNRYIFLVYRILMTVETFSLGGNAQAGQMMYCFVFYAKFSLFICLCRCAGVLRTTQVLMTATTLVTALFTSLRMYAIWYKNPKIFGLVFLLGIVPIGVNMFYYTKVSFIAAPPPFVGCADQVNMTQSASDICEIHPPIMITANCVAQWGYSTTIETRRTSPAGHSTVGGSFGSLVQTRFLSYTTLIQRDGTIYFVVLLCLNVVNLVVIKYQAFGALPALTEVLTSILVSRFLLDLRSVYLAGAEPESTKDPSTIDPRASASMVFAAGNLGAPLEDIMSDAEDRYMRVATDEIAYVSEDPLAVGLHTSREDEDVEVLLDCGRGLRSLKELNDEPV